MKTELHKRHVWVEEFIVKAREDEMVNESKELLEAMGIQVVQAPGEGEAQAAQMCKRDRKIYASVSQDYLIKLY